jgi:hypothetical protein
MCPTPLLSNLGVLFEKEVASFVFLGGEVGTDMIIDLWREQRGGREL